ncbi:MAG: hypothetical protein Q4C95_07285 [Planctomycetia bacterium]|nr:hypothetical protein [Planctomycetia bacterium]
MSNRYCLPKLSFLLRSSFPQLLCFDFENWLFPVVEASNPRTIGLSDSITRPPTIMA